MSSRSRGAGLVSVQVRNAIPAVLLQKVAVGLACASQQSIDIINSPFCCRPLFLDFFFKPADLFAGSRKVKGPDEAPFN